MTYYNITAQNIINGIKNTKWPYRLQKIENGKLFDLLPPGSEFYIDGAHNISGAKVVADFLMSQQQKYGMKNYIINGRTKDTDSNGFLQQFINKVEMVVAVRVKMEAIPESPYKIAEVAEKLGIKAYIGSSLADAIENIVIHASDEDGKKNPVRICICGSLYLARDLKVES